MTRRALITLVVVVAVTAACGIPADREPTITPGGVVMPVLAPTESPEAGGPAGPSATEVSILLVEAEHLRPVIRAAQTPNLGGVLGLLLAGPNESEFAAGIRTAISPQTELLSANIDGGTATIDLSAAFVEVGGQEQILAVAQIVLTATGVAGVSQVRLLLEGQAVEVPRADGTLTADSLRAADYERLRSSS